METRAQAVANVRMRSLLTVVEVYTPNLGPDPDFGSGFLFLGRLLATRPDSCLRVVPVVTRRREPWW